MKILVTFAVLIASAGAAAAFPLSPPPSNDRPKAVLVSGGCGLAFHRNPFGACVPNRPYVYVDGPVRLPPPCPRFYHRDPDPARPLCYPNY